MSIWHRPFLETQSKCLSGEITISSLVDEALSNAQEKKDLKAYVELYSEKAKAKAEELDQKIKNGKPVGKLAGLILSVKDVIAQKDCGLTAASTILNGFKSPYDATIISRLLAEDAIVIGRTNCDEFAMGSATANSIYGSASNAIDSSKVPGGSSGGTAISVAIDSCHVGIGSDTGGSVRQPAAFHNIYGFKPSYGRYSRHGLISYASSFDQIGFITRDWDLIPLLHEIVNGPDDYDSTLLPREDPIGQTKTNKIGLLKEAFGHSSLDAEIASDSLSKLEEWSISSNVDLEEVSFALLDYLVPTYYVLACAEASSNLSRYDGVRYGHRAQDSKDLEDMYRNTRTEGFGIEVKRRLMTGTFVLSSGYYDAYFDKAQRMRKKIVTEVHQMWEKVDMLALPISPILPWAKDDKLSPVDTYLLDIYSVMANLLGAPSCVVPLNLNSEEKPISVQFIGKPGSDNAFLLNVKKFISI